MTCISPKKQTPKQRQRDVRLMRRLVLNNLREIADDQRERRGGRRRRAHKAVKGARARA